MIFGKSPYPLGYPVHALKTDVIIGRTFSLLLLKSIEQLSRDIAFLAAIPYIHSSLK